jgi:membrane-bound lytic murein transglycosylase B
VAPGSTAARPAGTASTQLAASGIASRAVQAYQHAAVAADCGIPWTLVAAIGRVESNHGQFAGATLLSDGRSDPPIIGIPLDGRPGVAEIKDTDGGKWDGDKSFDRAVGTDAVHPQQLGDLRGGR